MSLRWLARALTPVSLLFAVCATGGPVRPRRRFGWTRDRDRVFTPSDWPQPLKADLYRPCGVPPPGGWPALLMIHGGGWHGGDRAQVQGLAERLVRRGYLVLNVTYRLVPQAIFPAQLQDVQQAVLWLRANAAQLAIDPARIGAWGYSAGAHLAALLGGIGPGDPGYVPGARVAAVVAGGTPADLRKFRGGTLVPNFLGERWRAESRVFREASPAAYVRPGHPPVFLYHGGRDRLVPLDQATDYRAALAAAGVPNALHRMRGLGHIGTFLLDGTAVQRGADFLDRYLREPVASPGITAADRSASIADNRDH